MNPLSTAELQALTLEDLRAHLRTLSPEQRALALGRIAQRNLNESMRRHANEDAETEGGKGKT